MQLKLNYQNIHNFILNMNIKALLIPFATLVFLLQFYIYTKYFQNIYVDSDQLIVALAAKNYASFNIPEPFFFGQKHLFLIESFLSAPLIWFGLRPDLSVNLMCGILFYSPFLIATIYLRKINLAICSSILLLPFIIDTKYSLIAMLPRGFMGAIGLGAIATLIFLLDNRDKLKKMALILLGVSVGSYTAAVLYVPLLLMRHENFSESLKNFLFLSVGFFVIKSFGIFYYYHPEYVVFPSPDFHLTINTLKHSLSSFSILNAPFSSFPILWFLLSMLIINKNDKSNRPNELYKKAIFAASGIIFIIFLMMSAKHINASSNSIFYSGVRFYLALPFCALIIVSKLACFKQLPPPKKYNSINYLIGFTIISACFLYNTKLWIKLNRESEVSIPVNIPIAKRERLIKSCKKIDALLGKQYFYGIIVGRNDLLAYGCDVYASRKIIQTEYDRRAWLVNDLTQNLASFKYIQDSDINQ